MLPREGKFPNPPNLYLSFKYHLRPVSTHDSILISLPIIMTVRNSPFSWDSAQKYPAAYTVTPHPDCSCHFDHGTCSVLTAESRVLDFGERRLRVTLLSLPSNFRFQNTRANNTNSYYFMRTLCRYEEAAAILCTENTCTCAKHFRNSSVAREDRVSKIVGGEVCTIIKASCISALGTKLMPILSDRNS